MLKEKKNLPSINRDVVQSDLMSSSCEMKGPCVEMCWFKEVNTEEQSTKVPARAGCQNHCWVGLGGYRGWSRR